MNTLRLLVLGALLLVTASGEPQAEAESLSYSFKIRTKQAIISIPYGVSKLIIDVQDSDIERQEIHLDPNEVSISDYADVNHFESYDYNEDGFMDFSIRDSTSATPNEIRHYFFWNPKTGRFGLRDDVKESWVSHFDPESRTFSNYWRMEPNSKSWSEWKFVGAKFLCVKDVVIGYGKGFRDVVPNVEDDEVYRITTIYKQDGSFRKFYRRERW